MLKRSTGSFIAVAMLAAYLAFSTGVAVASAPDVRTAAPEAQAATPQSPGVLDNARGLAGTGDFSGAIAELRTYAAAHPEDVAAESYLGDLYVRTGDLQLAERTYLAVLSVAPRDKAVHDRLGNAYAADDLVPQAIEQYQLSLPDVIAYADLVHLHRHIGDLAAFVAKYETLAQNNTQDYTSQLGYGVILLSLRRSAEAADYLQRAVVLAPRSCAAYTELGTAELDLQRLTAAAADYRQCLAINPNDYGALVDLSLTYDPVRDARAALALLDRAVALEPNRPEALVDFGYVADASGRSDDAIGYYHKALAADVLARDAYVDLGYDYQEQRMFVQAEAVLLKGLSVSPRDGRIEYLLGKTYSQQGKRTLALQQFTAATRSDEPDVSEAASAALTTLQ
jgi:tetratricopeptide (TPR) repeat protein